MRITFFDRTSDAETDRKDARSHLLDDPRDELRWLERQGALFRSATTDMLRLAGLGAGMQVLDVGCGVGDVSLIAGDLVGPSGSVLGIDRSAAAVDAAERRAAERGQCYWVRFAAADLEEFSTQERFDAVIGRLILLYVADPAATLRRLAAFLRPGGVVAFQEMAMPLIRSVPEGPEFRTCRALCLDTFARAGIALDMGSRLFAAYLAAGLPAPEMTAGGVASGGPQSPVYDYLAATLRSLLPSMERLGVATAAEVGIETLADRLRTEAVENRACIMLPPLVGAWARKPEQPSIRG